MQQPFRKGIYVLFMICAAVALSPAQTFTTVLSFDGTNGGNPNVSLIQGIDGAGYGATTTGGANGYGTIFKITPRGRLTTLYTFTGYNGYGPYASDLVQATDGTLYGTAAHGGFNTSCSGGFGFGCGSVFDITPSGKLTTLYSFCAQPNCSDGDYSGSRLVQATDGNFYGTTAIGGTNNYGTVFKITPHGTLTTLYSFCQHINSQGTCMDGAYPSALIQATDGNLYGTTGMGGTGMGASGLSSEGCGTIFTITLNGTLTTLYSFKGFADGRNPSGPLVQARNGRFYGMTSAGAALGRAGTIFSMTSAGKVRTIYAFSGPDGLEPIGGLIQASDGNLYGTTEYGGASWSPNQNALDFQPLMKIQSLGYGTIFTITPAGALTTLYTFKGQTDGWQPEAPLLQATDGSFYGTTAFGGASTNCITGSKGCGTVFNLILGLGPFIKTLPTSGNVGALVQILGTNLKEATSVSFNGTTAPFTVNSAGSAITTAVPDSATTGVVQVVTPSGTLSSNVAFQVR
jgi:uncharacterized repeat protein (TIGR03803 family)